MSDRHLGQIKRSAARSFRFAKTSSKLRPLLNWCLIALGANVVLLSVAIALWLKDSHFSATPASYASAPAASSATPLPIQPSIPSSGSSSSNELGPRHQLNYQEWVILLEQEAQAVAEAAPDHLNILLGDSLSLWFPFELLPPQKNWLNQGISGEISAGLLQRLDAIESTQPETIFVMIGINDLLRNISDETVLANQTLILQELRAMHPDAQIVMQSILPHAADQATWEGRENLVDIPNQRIQDLNARIEAIARQKEVYFLDLYPLFSDSQGNLHPDLTTDGLHLNDRGYLVWRSALLLYEQLELES
ncbi:MAG: SGNH/GDSL hydrolase family protein [Elainellaceae cyanobacterium]